MNNKFKTVVAIGSLAYSVFMCIYAYKEWKKTCALNKACAQEFINYINSDKGRKWIRDQIQNGKLR